MKVLLNGKKLKAKVRTGKFVKIKFGKISNDHNPIGRLTYIPNKTYVN